MIVLVTKDLFFVPVIRSACEKLGIQLLVVTRPDGPKIDAAPEEQVAACVIDLSSVSAASVGECVISLRQSFPAAKVIAFGPHVQTGRLAAAEEAECDQILTRGQLSSQIDRLAASWIQAKPDSENAS